MSNVNVQITGQGEVAISINGEAPVTKTVKPIITVEGSNLHFVCDDIDVIIEPNETLLVDGQLVKNRPIANQYNEQAVIFNMEMADLFSGASVMGLEQVLIQSSDAGNRGMNNIDTVGCTHIDITLNGGSINMKNPSGTEYKVALDNTGTLVVTPV